MRGFMENEHIPKFRSRYVIICNMCTEDSLVFAEGVTSTTESTAEESTTEKG